MGISISQMDSSSSSSEISGTKKGNASSTHFNSPDQSESIQKICEDFENQWKRGQESGEDPSIKDHLTIDETLPDHSTLFEKLVLIDVQCRRSRGEEPKIERYLKQFPNHRPQLLKIFPDEAGSVDGSTATTNSDPEIERKVSEDHQQILKNAKLDDYDLIHILGKGSYGIVYLAWLERLKRHYAIKIPRAKQQKDDQGEDVCVDEGTFFHEGEDVAKLEHPNIVQVHNAGVGRLCREGEEPLENVPYIVTQYIDGKDLKKTLSEGIPDFEVSVKLCCKIANALDHAHQLGLVHRDVKPSNILLNQQGEPFLTDFGLARRRSVQSVEPAPSVEGTSGSTAETVVITYKVLGTPRYMSPEQARGESEEAGPQADVYSLGVVLFEMLTGTVPFDDKSISTLIHKIRANDIPDPRNLNSEIPDRLAEICLKALEKDSSKRFKNAAEFEQALQNYLDEEPPPKTIREWLWRWLRRHALLVVSLLCVVLVVALGVLFQQKQQAAEPTPVMITTTPEGATVTLVKLDPKTGEPDPTTVRTLEDKTPVQVDDLESGGYLVVVVDKDNPARFNEVYRRVADPEGDLGGSIQSHYMGVMKGGVLHLAPIPIPKVDSDQDMILIEGTDRFEVGTLERSDLPPHHWRIPSFLVAPTEVTVQQLLDHNPKRDGETVAAWRKRVLDPMAERLSGNHAVPLSWDKAIKLAEQTGMRLPSEAEWEYLTTNGGRTRYPWGDDETLLDTVVDEFGPVGTPEWDRLQSDPRVKGLCTNLAEWTSTHYHPYPEQEKNGVRVLGQMRKLRIVRGGNNAVIKGNAAVSRSFRLPRHRQPFAREETWPGLGVRFVRSPRPRTRPEDFPAILPE